MENPPFHRDDAVMSRFKVFSVRKTILLWLPLMLVGLISGSAYWLLHTPGGATWLWNKVQGLESLDIRSSRVTGDLASGFVVQDMEYRSASLDLSVRRLEIEAGPGWWPVSIQLRRLSLQDVDIHQRSPDDLSQVSKESDDIRKTLELLKLPVPLAVADAVINNINLQQDDKPPVKIAESIGFRVALDEWLLVDHLDILAEGLETNLQGSLELKPPFKLAVTARGLFEKASGPDEPAITLPFKLEADGDLDQLQLRLDSDKYGLQLDGEILDPAIRPAWDINARIDHAQWPEKQSEQALVVDALKLVSRGNIDDWSFGLDSGLQVGLWQDAQLAVTGSGSKSSLKIGHAALTGPGVDLELEGELDWSAQTEAVLNAVITQLDLSPWLSDWPAGEKLAGDLNLNWSDNGLQIPAGQLTVTGTSLKLNIEADIDIEANRVNAGLDWSNLSWPLKDTKTGFSSQSGRLNISGSVDDWLAGGELDVKVGDYPQGRFEIQGGGDRNSMHLVIPAGEILGGSISGEADADWAQGLNWDAAILTRGIDPEPLLPGWPGQLDSEIEVSAKSQTQQTQINLIGLEGQLRGVPLSAHGGLDLTQGNLGFQRFEIRTDEAVLELDGAPADPSGASVKFMGQLPSRLLQGASGNLELEGRYSSDASQPLLELQLQALDLAWNDLSVKSLAVNSLETEKTGRIPAFQLDALEVSVKERLIDELSLSLNPAGDEYQVKMGLMGETLVLNTLMSLVPENRNDLLGGSWQGVLSELDLAVGPAYSFELSGPAAITRSAASTSLKPLCLLEKAGASLCLDLDLQNNGDWSLVADATAIPFDYLRDLLELEIHFEQLLEGHMEWHQSKDGAPTGGAEFRITAGRIVDLLDNDLLTETNDGRFAFSLRNGNLESGVLDLEFPGTGFIDVDFDVLDIAAGGEQKVQGRAIAELKHLTLLGQIALPGVDAVDGQFESNIQLGGSLSDPEFDGAFKFSNGFIHYDPIGLQLEDIEFEGRVTQRDRGSFKGRFRAGEGIASLDGDFLFENMERVKLGINLSGEQLLLVNTDTLKILTETELTVGLSPQRMDINGRITVPSASLTPANLILGEVRDSEDLVIENPEGEAEPLAIQAPEKNQIFGRLEVAFGDDVVIKVPGIETNLSGSTMFNWSGEPIPMADGLYTLKGTVDVYGPMLEINNGSISFPGVPANNPLLNIRAGRDIFGNTQIRRAGVRVIGSLKRPVVEAYTVPVTNEDRAWTLLITGTDFDQGQGVSGFDVGTYIAPKLYVSYGISLFEDENVISARYDIKKGFGIKVTSGQRETGLDVSYTIDR